MKHLKDQSTALTCFKAYDVRGKLGVNFDAAIAYRIGRAVAQHFQAKRGNVSSVPSTALRSIMALWMDF